MVYTYGFVGIMRLGAGQFYLISIRDKNGASLDGNKTYRPSVPPNVPIEQYWSVTAYGRKTHALIRNMPRTSRSSQIPEMLSMAETKCAGSRRDSVPVGLREKGFEALVWC